MALVALKKLLTLLMIKRSKFPYFCLAFSLFLIGLLEYDLSIVSEFCFSDKFYSFCWVWGSVGCILFFIELKRALSLNQSCCFCVCISIFVHMLKGCPFSTYQTMVLQLLIGIQCNIFVQLFAGILPFV